jgi:hypothetical protein
MRSAAMFAALFGWGNMRDPRNDTVAEAQDGRLRGGDESGDPLQSAAASRRSRAASPSPR